MLGDLRLRYSVALGGTFTLPFTVADGDIPSATPPTGFALDESTGTVAAVVPETFPSGAFTGRFSYAIPVTSVGPHRVRFAIAATVLGLPGTWVGGPVTQNIPDTSEGQSITLAATTVRVPDLVNTGKLRFRVSPAAGAPAFTVRVNTVPPTTEQTPAPDSTGWVELDVTEGIYSVYVDLGAVARGLRGAAVTGGNRRGQPDDRAGDHLRRGPEGRWRRHLRLPLDRGLLLDGGLLGRHLRVRPTRWAAGALRDRDQHRLDLLCDLQRP